MCASERQDNECHAGLGVVSNSSHTALRDVQIISHVTTAFFFDSPEAAYLPHPLCLHGQSMNQQPTKTFQGLKPRSSNTESPTRPSRDITFEQTSFSGALLSFSPPYATCHDAALYTSSQDDITAVALLLCKDVSEMRPLTFCYCRKFRASVKARK